MLVCACWHFFLHAHVSVGVFVCIHTCLCMCTNVYRVCRCPSVRRTPPLDSVRVDEEAGEGAVFVCVPSVDLPSVQLHAHLIAHVQMQDHTVGGVVVILISILSDGAGSHLSPAEDTRIDN